MNNEVYMINNSYQFTHYMYHTNSFVKLLTQNSLL